VTAPRFEELEHPGVVGVPAPGQREADDVLQVVVADADRVGAAERALHHLSSGPDADPGDRAQPPLQGRGIPRDLRFQP
jgi:hypothetical protein